MEFVACKRLLLRDPSAAAQKTKSRHSSDLVESEYRRLWLLWQSYAQAAFHQFGTGHAQRISGFIDILDFVGRIRFESPQKEVPCIGHLRLAAPDVGDAVWIRQKTGLSEWSLGRRRWGY
ncbi:MAG: hypothetical protein WCH43_14570 [Verrucomicrobiota bacterium]